MVLLAMCRPSIRDCSCSCTCVENVSDLNDCSQWNKNVLGCLEQHDLLVLAFFTPCKVVKLCLSEARINFKNISSFIRQLYPLAKTVFRAKLGVHLQQLHSLRQTLARSFQLFTGIGEQYHGF